MSVEEGKPVGMTPVLGELGNLTIEGAPGTTESGTAAPKLYPSVDAAAGNVSSTLTATEGGPKGKSRCVCCQRSIRHDHLASAIKCACPQGDQKEAGSAFIMHQVCRDLLLQNLALEQGYVSADGKGNPKHAEFVQKLATPMSFFINAPGGMLSGYMLNGAVFCSRCIAAKTPCTNRRIFDRDDASTSSARRKLRLPRMTPSRRPVLGRSLGLLGNPRACQPSICPLLLPSQPLLPQLHAVTQPRTLEGRTPPHLASPGRCHLERVRRRRRPGCPPRTLRSFP